jgi:hypothetical protein
VLRGQTILASFACDQDRPAVAAILQAQGYAVHSDCAVTRTRIDAPGA